MSERKRNIIHFVLVIRKRILWASPPPPLQLPRDKSTANRKLRTWIDKLTVWLSDCLIDWLSYWLTAWLTGSGWQSVQLSAWLNGLRLSIAALGYLACCWRGGRGDAWVCSYPVKCIINWKTQRALATLPASMRLQRSRMMLYHQL